MHPSVIKLARSEIELLESYLFSIPVKIRNHRRIHIYIEQKTIYLRKVQIIVQFSSHLSHDEL